MAAVKDILLYLRAGEPCETSLSLAAALAGRFDATLTGLCISPEPELAPADSFAIGPSAVGEVIAHSEAAIEHAVAPCLAAFQAACSAVGAPCRCVRATPFEDQPGQLALAARCYDLALVGRRPGDGREDRRLAELVAINSGAPCLVIPEGSRASPSFERIVVAWNGSCEARHALGEGMAFIETAKDVRVVTVGWDPDQSRIDDLLRHLAAHGVEAGFERVTNRVDHGAAIIDRCAHFGADLLIMGAFAHAPATEMVLGGVTRTVLNESAVPVLMAH